MNYVSIVFILIGAVLLYIATYKTMELIKSIPDEKLRKPWQNLRYLMIFFIGGYATAILGIVLDFQELLMLLIGVVFLVGSLFVVVVVNAGMHTIKELKESLLSKEEKVVLLKEIHHRVKNNLQIINSLLNLQCSKVDDEKLEAIIAECQRRTRAMALVHESLYQSENLATINLHNYFTRVLDDLVGSYQLDSKVELVTDIGDHEVDLETIVPLGLIVSELVSNALKHAFKGRDKGVIKISMVKDAENKTSLIIEDNGIGMPPELLEAEKDSLGLDLVVALSEQLDGDLSVENNNGTTFKIRFKKECNQK